MKAEVIWKVVPAGKDYRAFNEEFNKLPEDQQAAMIVEALSLLTDPARREEAVNFWGAEFMARFGERQRLMKTVTKTGRQFRIWWDSPCNFSPDHVDSNGHGLLIHVEGRPADVYLILARVLDHYKEHRYAILHPTGCRVYLGSWW